ncbi:MAG: RluA family pseudouridine synthase [Lachnospiraceae bacterium]|nr:RluA family pseudouridine synthase [Lachnospiraceae bacterium]
MEILYEDREIVVVYKEAGLAAETKKRLEKDLLSLLSAFFYERDGKLPELHLIHRLDQPVDGLVLLALTASSAAVLSKELAEGGMEKMYRARVEGRIPEERGELCDYLIRDGRTNTSRTASPGSRGAKRALLTYEKKGEDLLFISLKTGRHHQIRVQLAHAGMPVAGDIKYGASGDKKDRGILLTAAELSFTHPKTGKRMRFQLPERLLRF